MRAELVVVYVGVRPPVSCENRADGWDRRSGRAAAVRIEAADDAMFRERDAWRYEPPYDFYDSDGLPVKNPEFFFAARDDQGALIGFYFFEPCGDALLSAPRFHRDRSAYRDVRRLRSRGVRRHGKAWLNALCAERSRCRSPVRSR